jgi:hypothetical protein
MRIVNRVTKMLGPSIQSCKRRWNGSPAQLASAVPNAGGMDIIETSSGALGEIKEEIRIKIIA